MNEVLNEETKKQKYINQIGDQLGDIVINDLYKHEYSSDEFFKVMNFLKILGKLNPKILLKRLTLLVNLLVRNSTFHYIGIIERTQILGNSMSSIESCT